MLACLKTATLFQCCLVHDVPAAAMSSTSKAKETAAPSTLARAATQLGFFTLLMLTVPLALFWGSKEGYLDRECAGIAGPCLSALALHCRVLC